MFVALMMEAVSSSETSVTFYQTTRPNILQDNHLHTCRLENLKSHHGETNCRIFVVANVPEISVSCVAGDGTRTHISALLVCDSSKPIQCMKVLLNYVTAVRDLNELRKAQHRAAAGTSRRVLLSRLFTW
jgi:hypothetical protein